MDTGVAIALIIAGITFLWTLYRDKSGDTEELMSRVGDLETKVLIFESTIDRLATEQDEMKKSLKSLEDQIHQLDLKIERILTILEK
ncbi:hypothetical protein AB6866_04820 [Rahnella inusitata]|uniref:hypothetical protein n=1 Tax=Rahnella inusitata TaxID=58169 RepID=UPI0039BE7322